MFAAQWTSKGGPSLTPLSHDPAIAIVDCDCKVPFMASDVTPSPGGFGNGMSPSCVCFFGIVAMLSNLAPPLLLARGRFTQVRLQPRERVQLDAALHLTALSFKVVEAMEVYFQSCPNLHS